MHFGDRLKILRERKGYTQEQLGELIGAAKTTISNYESGKREPDVEKIKKLARVLDTTGDELLGTGIKGSLPMLDRDLSSEDLKIAWDYKSLDYHGKRMVQIVVDEEKDRMKEEIKRAREAAQDRDDGPKVINLFVEPSAAGIAVPTMGVDYEIYELKPEDPPGAAYAVRLQGNSMEPDFPDGSIVFVNHDALRDGDVGIFSVDGGTVCKQYHQEGGVVYLFSLNRRRSDADLVLFPGGNRSFVCQGRVMTRRRYPVPGRG